MKTSTLIAANLALLTAAALGVQAAGQNVLYTSAPGSSNLVWIEGTANLIHTTWWVKGNLIAGMIEVGSDFPTEPGQAVTPGKVQCQATNVFIQVRSLKSCEKDGKPYSDSMDEVMYEHLKVEKNPAIRFHLTELTLKEAPKSKDAPYLFEAKGRLAVAGVTNTISMPVKITPLEDKKLRITASPVIKMSDYKAGPVEKTILGLGIKSGDEVKLSLDWTLKQRPLPGAAVKK
jgi:hypothetical protein